MTACGVCGTFHAQRSDCPGELRATGPERHGWRVHIETPAGLEAIGILVAPSYDLWRARVLTYPNILWAAPGAKGTLKFVGRTPEEAESQAIRFVEEHCVRMGWLRRDGLEPVEAARLPLEAARRGASARESARPHLEPARPSGPRRPSQKHKRALRMMAVRYGARRPSTLGQTVNLSQEGMFIATAAPLEPGEPILIHIDVDGHTVPMSGLVIWCRARSEPGRPLGMGIRLADPPEIYARLVRTLP